MKRRHFLLGSVSALALPAWAHSPYRQWRMLRQTHLLIHTHREDAPGDELGEQLAALLLRQLPDSRAMVARGRYLQRIASLLATAQAEVAVLNHADAWALFQGNEPLQEFGAVAVARLVETPTHQLVCRAAFSARHAYMVSGALLDARGELPLALPSADSTQRPPLHPGVLALERGEPLPEG